jgi:hypothetical protein
MNSPLIMKTWMCIVRYDHDLQLFDQSVGHLSFFAHARCQGEKGLAS